MDPEQKLSERSPAARGSAKHGQEPSFRYEMEWEAGAERLTMLASKHTLAVYETTISHRPAQYLTSKRNGADLRVRLASRRIKGHGKGTAGTVHGSTRAGFWETSSPRRSEQVLRSEVAGVTRWISPCEVFEQSRKETNRESCCFCSVGEGVNARAWSGAASQNDKTEAPRKETV